MLSLRLRCLEGLIDVRVQPLILEPLSQQWFSKLIPLLDPHSALIKL